MATREELEAQIEASPGDEATYLILADWLQVHGDPRGELIALDAAAAAGTQRGEWRKRRADLVAAHPSLVPLETGLQLVWRFGFVRRAILTKLHDVEVFAHPAFRFLSEIVVPDSEPLLAGFVEQFLTDVTDRVPLLRMLALGDPDVRRWPTGGAPIDLDRAVPRLGQLEQLYTITPIAFRAAPHLRVLEIHGGDRHTFVRLGGAALPALERLVIGVRVRADVEQGRLDDLRWLFERPPPALTSLELLEVEFGDDMIRELVGSPLLRQLRVLRLWNAGLTRSGARLITREAFGHLELLDLSDPLLDDDTIRAVSGVCREVRTISPWMRQIERRPG
ncbi:MAG: TIGR02996 domain-containing protein [Deltaproteobacteria bacterium]|nr:TIGR02996 domain-containing protein [Deltaproteobacteria bacterium]